MFNLMDLFFDWSLYNYTRPVRDDRPYKAKYIDDNHVVYLVNVLGLGEEDIKITTGVADNGQIYIDISGENTDEVFGSKYSIGGRFFVKNKDIDKIDYTIKNGLLYLNVYYKKVDMPAIPINKISTDKA